MFRTNIVFYEFRKTALLKRTVGSIMFCSLTLERSHPGKPPPFDHRPFLGPDDHSGRSRCVHTRRHVVSDAEEITSECFFRLLSSSRRPGPAQDVIVSRRPGREARATSCTCRVPNRRPVLAGAFARPRRRSGTPRFRGILRSLKSP